jgi:hypothetical protein
MEVIRVKRTFNTVTILIFFLSVSVSWAQQPALNITEMKTEPNIVNSGERVVISCRVTNATSSMGIERVAAVASFSEWNTLFPNLYDDGSNGDKVAGDGIFSLEIQVSVQPGEIKILFNAVDKEGEETESEPIFLTVK